MEKYLTDKGYDGNIIEQVIVLLSSFNYLDDKAFARQFIEGRIRHKPKSVLALEFELCQKGIDPAFARKLLTAYKDEELALKAVENKMQIWNKLYEAERRKKIMNYLRYRGFSYSVCQTVWQRFQAEF
ncbi:MAG: hypothetical protein CSA25_06790 [Desulfobacter postgatei]|uniref:Regulatory protein RecX n=1 Tax=Desulfobacter postgatei TaxID=2293 RepID=A0A2G6MQ37_9BACT|nr:MAG: hypothetical protein CSA25_06790 [Desulfobacter postgatei]